MTQRVQLFAVMIGLGSLIVASQGGSYPATAAFFGVFTLALLTAYAGMFWTRPNHSAPE